MSYTVYDIASQPEALEFFHEHIQELRDSEFCEYVDAERAATGGYSDYTLNEFERRLSKFIETDGICIDDFVIAGLDFKSFAESIRTEGNRERGKEK